MDFSILQGEINGIKCTKFDTTKGMISKKKEENVAKKNKHLGSTFEEFLMEEEIYEEVVGLALKEAIAYQIEKEMKKKKLSKTEMAQKMKTSRSALERLLDPKNESVTLQTLQNAASALGKRLQIQLV